MRTLQYRFKEEVRCHDYCMKEARKRIDKEDYGGAAVFYENVARSLFEMSKIKQEMEDLQNGKVTITATILHGRNRYFD